MKAEIISVGTELLLGQIDNLDAQYISQESMGMGIDIYYHTVVGDNRDRLLHIIRTAYDRSDLIIFTGGLGPTEDDLTKETVSEFLNLDLVEYPEAREAVIKHFHSRNFTENNNKQWMFPKGSILIPNNNGTAPGCILESNSKIFIVLPGPPNELKPMFKETVIPYIVAKTAYKTVIVSRVIKLYGISESALEERIKDIIDNQTNPTIAPLVGKGVVTLRITSKARSNDEAYEMIKKTEQQIRNRLGDYIYGTDDDTLPSVVADLLINNKQTLSVVESCTGGNIANLLTNIGGISHTLKLCEVTYSNQAKIDELGIPEGIIDKYGAVSDKTAKLMAEGIRKKAKTDIGLSITGIAGPDPVEGKPVGLFYIGISSKDTYNVYKYNSRGNRIWFKNYASLAAINELRKYILKYV